MCTLLFYERKYIMAYKVQKPCRICGKMYTPCADCENDKSAFHWRTIACSMKCAMEYFEKIEESRKPNGDNIEVSVIQPITEIENEEVGEVVSSGTTVSEDNKPTRNKKNYNESEQID